MSIKIFLLNVHSDLNAGDLALSRVTIQQLQTNFPNCRITLSMNDPQSYVGELPVLGSFFTWVMTNKKWNIGRLLWLGPATLIPLLLFRYLSRPWFGLTPKKLRPWLESYINADIIVSTAGGFYYSSGRGIVLLVIIYSLALALLAKKPLYIFPQSFGPFKYIWECAITRWLYTRARIVTVREPISVENLIGCKFPESKILLVPDVAFGFKGESKEAAQQWFKSQGIETKTDQPLLGMTVIDWRASNPNFSRQEIYEEAIIAVIEFFVNHYDGKVLILPQTWGPSFAEDDRIVAQRIVKKIPHLKDMVIAIEQPLSPDLLQAVFGEMDLVIGTRMHSNIFSMSRGVPVIPIGYLHKSMGIARMVGLEEWVIDINEVNSKILNQTMVRLWEKRNLVRAHLEQVIPLLIEKSEKVGKLIAQDFDKVSERH